MRVTGGGGDEIISEGVKSSEITGGSFQPSHQATSGVTEGGGDEMLLGREKSETTDGSFQPSHQATSGVAGGGGEYTEA
jgi:hypothetical protein